MRAEEELLPAPLEEASFGELAKDHFAKGGGCGLKRFPAIDEAKKELSAAGQLPRNLQRLPSLL
jgi:hypothetical protein